MKQKHILVISMAIIVTVKYLWENQIADIFVQSSGLSIDY